MIATLLCITEGKLALIWGDLWYVEAVDAVLSSASGSL